jgi:hypothetical protein
MPLEAMVIHLAAADSIVFVKCIPTFYSSQLTHLYGDRETTIKRYELYPITMYVALMINRAGNF